jgi:hypothetical protein
VAESRELPDYLIDALAHHHDEGAAPIKNPAVRLVSMIGYGKAEAGIPRLIGACQEEFCISKDTRETIFQSSATTAERVGPISWCIAKSAMPSKLVGSLLRMTSRAPFLFARSGKPAAG